jgi:uncharacterized protein YciI
MAGPDVDWAGLVEMCTDKGLLAKKMYVVFTSPTNGLGPVMENVEEHLAFQHELQNRGIMFGAGPFADDAEQDWEGEGMVIIRADSLEEATKIAESDPMHSSGARSFRIRPWLLNEGKVTIELTFSDKGMKVI